MFSSFTSSMEVSDNCFVLTDVLLMLVLELHNKMNCHLVVKKNIFAYLMIFLI